MNQNNKIANKVDELFVAQEKYYEKERETDELISSVLKEQLKMDIEVRTFIEDEDVRFEIQNLTVEEINKYSNDIEQVTSSKSDGSFSFYLNTVEISNEDEIEYIVKESLDFYTNGVSETKRKWLIEEAIMRYGDKDLKEEDKIEIKNFVIEQV